MVKKTEIKQKKREKAIEIAGQIEVLLQFSAALIPHLEILKETELYSSDRVGYIMSAAPIIMAVGGDYEEKEFHAWINSKRASALVNLIEVLKDTEDLRVEFKKSQAAKEKGRAEISRIFGI